MPARVIELGRPASYTLRARSPAQHLSLGMVPVSYERRRWPRTSSQIGKKTLILCYRRVDHRADQYRRARWPALHFCNKRCRFIRALPLAKEAASLIEKETTIDPLRYYRMWERFSTAIYSIGQTLTIVVSYEGSRGSKF